MRNKLICWLPIIVVAQVSMIESVQAQGWWAYHHAPYQDQHFNLDSTRRTDAGGYTNSSRSSYRDTAGPSVSSEYTPAGDSSCSANGSCATAKNALLRLWIPDGLSVEINGYQTSPQSLGGIHKNSRIFSLEELDRDRLSPCDIVVHAYDEVGQRTSYHYALAVQAGSHYQVRFPHGFQPVHAAAEDGIDSMQFDTLNHLEGPIQPGFDGEKSMPLSESYNSSSNTIKTDRQESVSSGPSVSQGTGSSKGQAGPSVARPEAAGAPAIDTPASNPLPAPTK